MTVCPIFSHIFFPIFSVYISAVRLVGKVFSVMSVKRTRDVNTAHVTGLHGSVFVISTGVEFYVIKVEMLLHS